MPPSILLMRHGETVWNLEQRMQGRFDSPLTVRGIEQARSCGKKIKDRLAGETISGVQSSPLGRCWQTAVIVADCLGKSCSTLEFDEDLREISWGDWDGLTASEIEANDGLRWQAVIDSKFMKAPPNGESVLDVTLRARLWLERQSQNELLLVVSHGMFGRALRCVYQGLIADAVHSMADSHTSVFELTEGRVFELPDESTAT